MPAWHAMYTEAVTHFSTDVATEAALLSIDAPDTVQPRLEQMGDTSYLAVEYDETLGLPFQSLDRSEGATLVMRLILTWIQQFQDENDATVGCLKMAEALCASVLNLTLTGIVTNAIRVGEEVRLFIEPEGPLTRGAQVTLEIMG